MLLVEDNGSWQFNTLGQHLAEGVWLRLKSYACLEINCIVSVELLGRNVLDCTTELCVTL